jgi:hypothetical protein
MHRCVYLKPAFLSTPAYGHMKFTDSFDLCTFLERLQYVTSPLIAIVKHRDLATGLLMAITRVMGIVIRNSFYFHF